MVCCGGNDTYGHHYIDRRNHCYLQCPKCNKTYKFGGIHHTFNDYLVKEKEKNFNLNEKIKALEKQISELNDEKKETQKELNSVKGLLEEKIKEEKNNQNENERKNFDVEMKNIEIQNLKIQFKKDLKIKELEYQIQINNIKNEYENKSKINKINLEKELDELKNEMIMIKSNNKILEKLNN